MKLVPIKESHILHIAYGQQLSKSIGWGGNPGRLLIGIRVASEYRFFKYSNMGHSFSFIFEYSNIFKYVQYPKYESHKGKIHW